MKTPESTMLTQKSPTISLPKNWPSHVKSAVLNVISLAHFSVTYARSWAAKSVSARVRIAAQNDRLHQEIALLRKELRIKDARMWLENLVIDSALRLTTSEDVATSTSCHPNVQPRPTLVGLACPALQL